MPEAGSGGDAAAGPLALVAFGSNQDDPLRQLRAAARAVAALAERAFWSSVYRTEPVGGPAGQADYLNAVAGIVPVAAVREPGALLEALLAIERRQGRRRQQRWGPRTLDLDLLAVGDGIVDEPGLSVPHPRMMSRAFVLAPLCELLPDWRHPATGETACAALQRVGEAGVRRTRLRWRPR